LKVLIACEFSGIVREAFAKRGHDAWSCDLLPTEIPGKHIHGNVLDILRNNWDLMIAHPPCTRLCNTGVRWLNERNLWDDMRKSAYFFKALWDARFYIPKVCIENPVMHKYAIEIIGDKYNQIIQPWQFGHGETKRTCFWLSELEELIPTNIVEGREQRVFMMPPSKNRWKERSRTLPLIAKAMAEQWG